MGNLWIIPVVAILVAVGYWHLDRHFRLIEENEALRLYTKQLHKRVTDQALTMVKRERRLLANYEQQRKVQDKLHEIKVKHKELSDVLEQHIPDVLLDGLHSFEPTNDTRTSPTSAADRARGGT